jgi:hypothetical protein
MILRALKLRQAINFYVIQNLNATDKYKKLYKASRKKGVLKEIKLTTND